MCHMSLPSTGAFPRSMTATNPTREHYDSSQAAHGRDQFAGNKLLRHWSQTEVYIATPSSAAVCGLLP